MKKETDMQDNIRIEKERKYWDKIALEYEHFVIEIQIHEAPEIQRNYPVGIRSCSDFSFYCGSGAGGIDVGIDVAAYSKGREDAS